MLKREAKRKFVRSKRGIMHQLDLDLRYKEECIEEDILVETPSWYSTSKIVSNSHLHYSTFSKQYE